jgi:hypothetical protein
MIELTAAATSALTRSYTYYVRAESWLGDVLLADDIPITSGQEQGDRSLRVPERISLSVPRIDRGIDWSPYADDSPLAANGQRIKIELGVGLGLSTETEWFQRGWFVINKTVVNGDTVEVEALGLLCLVDEARLVSPYQPTGTISATLQGLVEPALTIHVSGVSDRAVPSGINYDEDRLGAVLDLLDSWPADARVSPHGYLEVTLAGDSTTSVLSLTDGAGGTVIEATGESTREDSWNVVVARGTATDGAQVQGVAYLERGPKIYGGAFNPLPVPYFFPSPLLTTVDEAQQAAATVMARLSRKSSRSIQVALVPHPALVYGDVVTIISDAYTGDGVVDAYVLPYTADGGAMVLTVRIPNE